MTTAILVARMGSHRLPGKSMLPIGGKPMIGWMVERISQARSIKRIVLATTDQAEDAPLAALAERLGISCFRGSADDVLARVLGAAVAYKADPVVELLGDNPFVQPALIDELVSYFQGGAYDYTATVTTEFPHAGPMLRKFPVGIRVQAMSLEALVRCDCFANTPESREHSTSFMYQHPELFRIGYLEAAGRWTALNRPELTFAVNYRENLELVATIVKRSARAKKVDITLEEVLKIFDETPALHALMGSHEPAPSSA